MISGSCVNDPTSIVKGWSIYYFGNKNSRIWYSMIEEQKALPEKLFR